MNRLSFRNNRLKFKTAGKLTDHYEGIYTLYPDSIKENRRLWTCNWLDLQILGSQPIIMPKNLPDHWHGVPHWMLGRRQMHHHKLCFLLGPLALIKLVRSHNLVTCLKWTPNHIMCLKEIELCAHLLSLIFVFLLEKLDSIVNIIGGRETIWSVVKT